ncbi:hypothetical protein [Mycobacterium sp. 050134]|uniref:hypothetical protein n=1 Tax=Mycobacterium sp. 050134 TaxID=3096111 RepID=UPI002EDB373E
MGAKHRMTEPPEQTRPARRTLPAIAGICEVVSAVVVGGAALTALLVSVEPAKPVVVAGQGPPVTSQPVHQQGTVVAVSANSVTARSSNGYTQTYVVTPNTTLVTKGGSRPATAAPRFSINDEVDIVGTIEGGTALATAVADRDTGRGDGPPMDFVTAQPVSNRQGPT